MSDSVFEGDMNRVAKGFANLFADIFANSYDVARSPHSYNLPLIWHTVEGGIHRKSSFSEYLFDVEWNFHVSGIHILILEYNGIKLP